LNELQEEMDKLGDDNVPADMIEELTDLQVKAEQMRVYELEDRIAGITNLVGFMEEDMDLPVYLFSGGWKVRIGLSKIFMTAPDALLLDEPTNHLDLESVEWLESFLQKQSLPIALVSHDREFMDRVCGRVIETVDGMTYSYEGNYTKYVAERDARMAVWQRDWEKQETKVNAIKAYVKEHKGKQMMANARNNKIRELQRIKDSDSWLDPPPRYARRITFTFPDPPAQLRGRRKVQKLAGLTGVTHGYGDGADSVLFRDADFSVAPGDKIGIVGRNGSGTSTLLRLLMGSEEPSEGGEVEANDIEMTRFFTQHQADLLPQDLTVIEVARQGNEMYLDEVQLNDILTKFRFKGDRRFTMVKDLSGGEKARLAIVRMMLQPANLLVLDEPTNHLDIAMKETLEYSLREFDGAVVIVSHDRWFLSQTCKQIYAIEDGKVVKYDGDFRYYMDQNENLKKKIESHYSSNRAPIDSVPLSGNERRRNERGVMKKTKRASRSKEREKQIAEIHRLTPEHAKRIKLGWHKKNLIR